jgi:hypothetical protein
MITLTNVFVVIVVIVKLNTKIAIKTAINRLMDNTMFFGIKKIDF